jgi:hypothetical protein
MTETYLEDLERAEATIRPGMEQYLRVVGSLLDIRDSGAYRSKGYETFEAYCAGEFKIESAELLSLIETWTKQETKKPRKPRRNYRDIGPTALYSSNVVTKAAFDAIIQGDWPESDRPGYAYGIMQRGEEKKNGKVHIREAFFGIPVKDSDSVQQTLANSVQQALARGGAGMVKAYYALWARWYAEGGKPGGFITVDVNQFCDDLGYAKATNGGHKLERKQEASENAWALMSVTFEIKWVAPDGKEHRLRGPIWLQGVLSEDSVQEPGAPPLENPWDPNYFTYAPGQWFTDANFRQFAQTVGKIGVGLLQLSNNTDSWAIQIGGYLGTQIRANKYEPLERFAETILKGANLAQSPDERRRSTQFRGKFERAMDRLQEVGVIAGWTWDIEISEPDMNDADAIAAHGTDESAALPRNSWRNTKVLITLPPERDDDRERLVSLRDKHESKRKRLPGARGANGAEPDKT